MLSLLLAVALTVSGPAVPRPPADCPVALPSCQGGQYAHYATAGFGSGGPTHGECMYCEDGGVPVDPTRCHTCNIELNEEQQSTYSKLLAASRDGDVTKVLALALALPQRVLYNPDRASIQIKAACDASRIIASLRLETSQQRRVATGLPRVDNRSRDVMVGLQ